MAANKVRFMASVPEIPEIIEWMKFDIITKTVWKSLTRAEETVLKKCARTWVSDVLKIV